MRFSVLVPVYNVENYIEQCLNSILAQTFHDYELVLVDDGSTDRSGQFCDKYKERYPERIKVIHKVNQGLVSARRVGIKEASGDFCIFVDSDDFVEENLLETVDNYLNRDLNVDILLYSFRYYRNEKKDKRFKIVAEDGYVWSGEDKKELYEKISCGSDITSIWTKAIRTDILKEDPTDYTLYYAKNMAEDLLQSLYPLTKAEKIVYTDKVLYNYRFNDESISRNFSSETLDKKNTIHVYEKVLEYLKVWDLDTKEMKDKVNAKWFNEALYMILKSYELSASKKSRDTVLNYDWNRLIPVGVFDLNNSYENPYYQKLYTWWLKQDFQKIHRYFGKKKCYEKLKRLKRNLLG